MLNPILRDHCGVCLCPPRRPPLHPRHSSHRRGTCSWPIVAIGYMARRSLTYRNPCEGSCSSLRPTRAPPLRRSHAQPESTGSQTDEFRASLSRPLNGCQAGRVRRTLSLSCERPFAFADSPTSSKRRITSHSQLLPALVFRVGPTATCSTGSSLSTRIFRARSCRRVRSSNLARSSEYHTMNSFGRTDAACRSNSWRNIPLMWLSTPLKPKVRTTTASLASMIS